MAVVPNVASMARQDTEMKNTRAKRLLAHKSSLSSVLPESFLHSKKNGLWMLLICFYLISFL